MSQTTGFCAHFTKWREEWIKTGRPEQVLAKLKVEPLDLTNEKKEQMLEWQHKREVHKVRDLMKKTSE